MGAKILESNRINRDIDKQTEIMGMEITVVESNDSHALKSTLIDVPVTYDELNPHADQLIHITQPCEESSDMEKQSQLCGAPINATWKRIQRTPNFKTNPSHQSSAAQRELNPESMSMMKKKSRT